MWCDIQSLAAVKWSTPPTPGGGAGGVSGQLGLHNEALAEKKRGRYKVQFTRRQRYQLNGRNINENNERGTLFKTPHYPNTK